MKETIKQHKSFIIAACVILSASVFLAAYHYQETILRVLGGHGLVPRAEHFTELYFENHLALPVHIVPGKTEMFAFTIGNREASGLAYDYRVSFRSKGATSTEPSHLEVKSGSVFVDKGASATVEVFYTLGKPEKSGGTMVVELLDRKELIHFAIHE